MPSDITGTSVLNLKTQEFEFRPGPLFTQVLLADEINRATPKTQAALLEAMQERQVTVDGVTHPLPDPFFVLATQNPIELEGTFPLPEAQLDRFLLRVKLGYPDEREELRILQMHRRIAPCRRSRSATGRGSGAPRHDRVDRARAAGPLLRGLARPGHPRASRALGGRQPSRGRTDGRRGPGARDARRPRLRPARRREDARRARLRTPARPDHRRQDPRPRRRRDPARGPRSVPVPTELDT